MSDRPWAHKPCERCGHGYEPHHKFDPARGGDVCDLCGCTSGYASLDEAITEAARKAAFGLELLGAGDDAIAIDEEGQLRRYRPDGTSEPL